MIERVIAAGTHGRYLIDTPGSAGPAPILVGFHGYGEGAEAQLERMRRIPGAERWLLVSIQGLHRFYQRRANQVVASWMTRQDRDLAIADNLAYVAAVMDAVAGDYPGAPRLVFSGFSQGVAMTFRAAAAMPRPIDGVIAAGGDVPPEIDAAALRRVGRALVCHGTADEWYTQSIFDRDVERLRTAGVEVTPIDFTGGHEWSDEVVGAASVFLRELAR
jgi:predicted esterase